MGTEVSAKFKGAFCEAKIKRVEKQVVCKITLKCNNTQVTLDEEVLKTSSGQVVSLNDLKSGSVVYVQSEVLLSNGVELSKADLKQSINDLHAAILNKVNDKSVYSVIFNDGDERSLKRSFIRFKGEKHFHDSETLNNAPLNNPEHFLFPIKINNESESEPLSIGKTALNPIDSSKAASNMQLNEDEKALISSNKNTDQGENAESVDNNEEDDEDCSSSDSSDEYPAEVKDRFVAELYKFMDDRGTPMNKIPAVNKVDLDLHRLYTIVRKFGGYNRVSKQRSWNDVYKKLGLPNASNASHILSLKTAYERYLQPYEEIYRKLGSSICDTVSRHHNSSNSSSATFNKFDSHRLFKTRYLATPTTSTNNNANNRKNPSRNKQSKQQTSSNNEVNKDEKPATPSNDAKEDLVYGESTKELTLASLINSRSLSPCDDDEQQQNEELTLVGMVKTLNENYKKAKKEKESDKKQTAAEDSEDQTSGTAKSEKKNRKLNDESSSLKEERLNKNNKRLLSTSTQLRKGKNRTTSLDKLKTESRISSDEDEEEKIEPKSRRKMLKTDETSGTKSNSAVNKRKYSSNENNDNNDKESPDANMDSGSIETSNNETDENECKSITSFGDLEVNKLVDVYYGSNSQKHKYRAKIVQLNAENHTVLVHYLGWNIRYDEWIKMDRIVRLFNEDSSASKRRKPSKSSNGNQNTFESQSSPKETVKQQESTNNSSNVKSKSNTTGKLNNRSSSSSSSSSTSTTNLSSTNTTVNDSSSTIKEETKTETNTTNANNSTNLTSQEKLNDQQVEETTKSSSDNKPMLLSIKEEIIESDQESIEKSKTESNNSTKRVNSVDAKSTTEEIHMPDQTINETLEEKAIAKKKSSNKSNNSIENLEIGNTNSNTSSPQQTKSDSRLNETPNNEYQSPQRANSTDHTSKKSETNNSRRNSTDAYIQENKANSISIIPLLTPTTVINSKNDDISPNLQTNESTNKSTIINTTHPEPKYSFHVISNQAINDYTKIFAYFINNYLLNLDANLIGKQRIKQIEEQMKLCREAYTKLKLEIAAIDRKKKKLYQQRKEKSTTEDSSTVAFT